MRNLVVRFRLRAQKGRSFFDIVVAQSPQRHRGAFIAHLGYLNLTSTEKSFYIDVPRLAY